MHFNGRFFLEQMEEANQWDSWLNHVHLENDHELVSVCVYVQSKCIFPFKPLTAINCVFSTSRQQTCWGTVYAYNKLDQEETSV